MKLAYRILALLLCFISTVNARDIHIGLEAFPPIITENGTGYAIDMFKAIEEISDLKFHFHIMNYARAKKELKKKKLDMIGHTPKVYESQAF